MNNALFVIISLMCLGTDQWAAAQFSYQGLMENEPCSFGKFMNPTLVRAFKSKYPKKYFVRPGFDKDFILQAKYRLAEKILARHLRNMKISQCDKPNLSCEQARSNMIRPTFPADQSSVLAQQQSISDFQNPCETFRTFGAGSQVDNRGFLNQCYNQVQYYQQPGALSGLPLRSQPMVFPNQGMISLQR